MRTNTRWIKRGELAWQREVVPLARVYEPPRQNLPPVTYSDKTLAHGIYHRHVQQCPAEQGWMEREQLLAWANLDSAKFIEAAYNAKLLDCAIDLSTKIEVYRVLDPAKMMTFALDWKARHGKVKKK